MQPLKGVTALDISRLLPGGFASLLLRQLGARVIKVEQPGVGDYYRALKSGVRALPDTPEPPMGSFARSESDAHSQTLGGRQVDVINQGKESLGLDLKSSEGRDIFRKLVRHADVVIESFRPGTLKEWCLDYAVLRRLNRCLVLCSISGSGQKGTRASLAGHDLNYLGLSGLLLKIQDREGRPVVPDFQIVDLAAGQAAAMKIVAALFQRTKTKKGLWVDVSLEATARMLAQLYPPRHRSFLSGGLMRYGIYETADRDYVTFAPLEPKFWARFCRLIGHPEWADDILVSALREPEKEETIREFFRAKTKRELEEIGLKEDICLFPVEEISESVFAGLKEFPLLGTHTAKVLREVGYSSRQVKELRDRGIVT